MANVFAKKHYGSLSNGIVLENGDLLREYVENLPYTCTQKMPSTLSYTKSFKGGIKHPKCQPFKH
jgi:hypothetical protein